MTRKWSDLSKRGLALFLTLVMCLGMLQVTAFAEEEQKHTHNEDGWKCTSTVIKEGSPCNHQHDENCGYVAPTEGSPCNHSHNDECYTEGEPVLSCGQEKHKHKGTTCYDANRNLICGKEEHEHTEDCYTPGERVLKCTHEHNESCGYVAPTKASPCTHVHNENCGYAEAVLEWTCVPPSPCTHPEHTQDGKCTKCGADVEHDYDSETHLCSCGKMDPSIPAEKPEVNPDNPNGPKCMFCHYTGWHKDGCVYVINRYKGCPECRGLFGSHEEYCSQNPNNAKKDPPATSSFILTVGGDTRTVTIDQPLTKDLLAENIPASKTEGGQIYLLDQVQSFAGTNWMWYMAGMHKQDTETFFSAEDFYDNVWRDDRDFWTDIGVGHVGVEYALDSDNDGVADKYQSKVTYETGSDESAVVPYENLGFTGDGIKVPGNSWSHRYATETTISLGDYTPAVIEGSTFLRWEVRCDGVLLYTITEGEDADGNTVLTQRDTNGNIVCEISSKDYEGVSNLLTLIPLKIEGGKEYTVKAVFQGNIPPESVTVTFDANGGTGTMAPQSGEKGATVSVPANGFSRGGYSFNGWNTAANGSGTSYSAGASITLENDITLYAQWVELHTVTFNSNGGSVVANQTVAHNRTATRPANPTRNGYTFGGWTLGGTAYNFAAPVTSNITLVAVWNSNGSGGSSGGGGGGGTYRPSTGGGGGGGTVTIDDPDVPLAGGVELNREDHFAYVSGYEDGTVHPTNNITREEVAMIFYRLLTDTSRAIYETDVNDFSDVESTRWSNRAISTLVNAGILTGYEDGTFRPGRSITRAEFATIAAQFEVVTEDLANPFSDTTGHWAETMISFAASKGWVGGYEDGTFQPQKAITRAEAMTLVNNVLERKVDEEGLLADAKQWPDNQKGVWYYYEVLEATNSHDYTRRGEGVVENWTAITNN